MHRCRRERGDGKEARGTGFAAGNGAYAGVAARVVGETLQPRALRPPRRLRSGLLLSGNPLHKPRRRPLPAPTRMPLRMPHTGLLPALILALGLAGCADRERLTGPGGDPAGSFTLGPKTSYVVPPGTDVAVPDTVSGGIFVLSAGGGKLDVARIVSGPEAPAPGKGFWVDYQGSGRVRLEFPDAADTYEVLYAYGVDLGSISDSRGRTARWTCAPVAESLSVLPGSPKIRYELVMPFDWTPSGKQAGPGGSPGTTHVGFQAYHLAQLTPNSSPVQRFEAARRDAWRYLGTVIDSLPPALGSYVATQTAAGGTFEPTFYNSDDHRYKGFLYLTALAPITDPSIYLGPNSTEHSVAHETGHWVSHILAGSNRYVVLEAQAPDEHAPGQLHGLRSVVMEDYAHFCDYFCTGSVVNANPEEPWQFFAAFPSSAGLSPSAVDWPSLEGFGTVLLTSLIRKSSTIRSSTGQSEEIPVIGASFRQVWPLIASGAPTITVLRDSVEAFLGRRGQRALMAALAERIGWRYHAVGRLVDQDGQAIKNARVQAIYDDGTRVWRTPGSTTTGNDGRFSLSRIFPGDGLLRVWQGSDSVDVPIPVGWAHRTDEERNLGDITVGGALLAQLQRTLYVDIDVSAELHYSDGNTRGAVTLTSFTAYNDGTRPGWNATAFALSFSKPLASGSYLVTLDGTVSPNGREVLTLNAVEEWTQPGGTQRREFHLRNIPVEPGSIWPDEIYFSVEGAATQASVLGLVDTWTATGQPPVSISSIDWQGGEDPPAVVVRFATSSKADD